MKKHRPKSEGETMSEHESMSKNRRPSTKAKLEALKSGRELPVNPRALAMDMKPGEYPATDEKAVLTLAEVYQNAEGDKRAAVSWKNQEKAAKYFNEHGLVETLDEIVRVGGVEALS